MGITTFLTGQAKLLRGISYWRVVLTSGKELTEDQACFDLIRGARTLDWALDLVGSGDIARIKEIHLVTPEGNACMPIFEPYTALQFKRGTFMVLGDTRIMNAQIIGRVDNKDTGECTACIWDCQEQKLYTDFLTNVYRFGAWREGVTAIGQLSHEVIGLRLHTGGAI